MAEDKTPKKVVDDYINALKQESGKYNTFDEYEKAFSREYKRGIYYHLTDNSNFVVDLSKGATDAATGKMTPGSIMFTTDLDYWADTTWTDRPYVAILDLSDVDESQFTQVNRSQGNEFYLDDASKVKVKEVIPVDEALKQSELINQWGLDNLKNKEDLKNVIWDNRIDTPTNVVDINTEFETRPVLQNEEILQDGKYIKGSIREGQANRQDKILIESIEDFANYSKIPFTGDIEIIRLLGEGNIKSTKEIGFTDTGQLYIWHGIDDAYEYVDPKNEIALKKFLNENGLMNPLNNGKLYLPVSRKVDQEILTREEILKLPDTPDRPFGPGAAYIDEILNANTQLVSELPLSTTVKNQFDNFLRTRARNLATPGGAIDAVDIWELGITGLMITAIAYKEFDEIPTIFKRTATNMFNSMTASYNIPPVPLEEYDLDYEFINKVLTTGEKVMPTDIIIKKVGDVVKGAAETGAVTGFGYVPPNLTKTDTMETTQKIQPGVQEKKMFEQAKPKKSSGGGSGAKIL